MTKSLELTRAYAAATSYTDAQVGRVLNQLDVRLDLQKTRLLFSAVTMDIISAKTGHGAKTSLLKLRSVPL